MVQLIVDVMFIITRTGGWPFWMLHSCSSKRGHVMDFTTSESYTILCMYMCFCAGAVSLTRWPSVHNQQRPPNVSVKKSDSTRSKTSVSKPWLS